MSPLFDGFSQMRLPELPLPISAKISPTIVLLDDPVHSPRLLLTTGAHPIKSEHLSNAKQCIAMTFVKLPPQRLDSQAAIARCKIRTEDPRDEHSAANQVKFMGVKGVAHDFVLAGKVAQMAVRGSQFGKAEAVKVLDDFHLEFNREIPQSFGRHCEAWSALANMDTMGTPLYTYWRGQIRSSSGHQTLSEIWGEGWPSFGTSENVTLM
jgi:hypothetical protein